MFTVADLTDLFVESTLQTVSIWDCGKDKEVFRGTIDDIPEDLQELEVQSLDTIEKNSDVFTINVDSEH
jgi:hypothetical protein